MNAADLEIPLSYLVSYGIFALYNPLAYSDQIFLHDDYGVIWPPKFGGQTPILKTQLKMGSHR